MKHSPEREAAQRAVEADRDALASTVEGIVAKFDVKARARHEVEELKERHRDGMAGLRERAGSAKEAARSSGLKAGVRRALHGREEASDTSLEVEA